MQKINYLMIIIFIAVSLTTGQDDHKKEIPTMVLNEFYKNYPGSTVKEIGVKRDDGKKYYEFSFIKDKQEFEILYDSRGTVIELEETIDPELIPELIKNTIGQEIPQNSLRKIVKINKKESVYYYVKVLDIKKNRKYKLYITEDGRLIKKKKD